MVSEPRSRPYRGYDSALSCFLANQKEYDGMSRWKLLLSDPGMYSALREQGDLSKAIPQIIDPSTVPKRRRATLDEIFYIIAPAYKPCGGSSYEASRRFGYNPHIFLRVWKEWGYPVQGVFSAEEIDRMVTTFNACGSATKTAEILHHDRATVVKHLKRRGVNIKIGRPKKSQ